MTTDPRPALRFPLTIPEETPTMHAAALATVANVRTWLVDEGLLDPDGGRPTGPAHIVFCPGDMTRYSFVYVPPMPAVVTPNVNAIRDVARNEGLLIGLDGTGGWGSTWVAPIRDHGPDLFDVDRALGGTGVTFTAESGEVGRPTNPYSLVATLVVWSLLTGEPPESIVARVAGVTLSGMTGEAVLARWSAFA